MSKPIRVENGRWCVDLTVGGDGYLMSGFLAKDGVEMLAPGGSQAQVRVWLDMEVGAQIPVSLGLGIYGCHFRIPLEGGLIPALIKVLPELGAKANIYYAALWSAEHFENWFAMYIEKMEQVRQEIAVEEAQNARR